ncbi:hypothetical protein A1O3_00870 [Capronia epimyces CBS 606.96]|uniref:Apple domain-containing protein n=1 Tax=Capronia epimyces CBS 606.96 TaxID=1182542 RepID=W9YRK9_9EURO|nr:uncharacterized protein A1O3_00870 [Capronia epimyces CBS 606.96]EXJ92320.1 hypothetical protein A1O3_00870 [Capronia epimyces CBS 606.96]
MMVKSTSALVAASLLASAMAKSKSVEPVCKVVTITETGAPVWVPISTGWEDWDPVTSTSTAWEDWDPVTKTKTITAIPPKSTTVYTEKWDDWTSSAPEALTVTTYTTIPVLPTSSHTGAWGNTTVPITASSTAAASTTPTPAPTAATCPADNGQAVIPGGSCGCEFTVNCGVQASPDANSKFWQQSDSLVDTLEECLELCDNNSNCETVLWVDDSTSGDYHHCWQISGLGQPTGSGIAQISYKGTCSGTCASTYGGA